jgi:hypothetical protein
MTNNEFMKWFVKGFIAEAKGIPINWVVVTTTNQKKSRRKELE